MLYKKKNEKLVLMLLVIGILYAGMALPAFANNISVGNTVLQNQDLENGTVEVKFDLTWQNPFSGTDANGAGFYDRAWIFVKYWVVGTDSETTGWHHATLASGGTVTPVSDSTGAFVEIGGNQIVKWNYNADGVTASSNIRVRVIAIEMVYIPEGAFVYNLAGIGGSTFSNYGAGAQATVSSATDIPTGAAAGWPNGYSAFYIAKYEVSQGQYADYLNMLSATDATARYIGSYGTNRQSVSYASGNAYGLRYAADSASRSQNYLSWDDCRAYTSWCGLRPLTEMELEKAARGGGTSNTNVYPWGATAPSTSTYTFDSVTISMHYACYNNTSGGPTDVGHYLSGDTARTDAETGASVYGVTDLAGNNWEHLINCAHLSVPSDGNGTLTWPTDWPDAASGKGVRGGSWNIVSSYLRVSDRISAGDTHTHRNYNFGFRSARTP